MRFGACILLAVGALSSCERTQPTHVAVSLAPDVAALVGREPVSVEAVRQIAAGQGVSPQRALEFAVRDAIWAAAARDAPGGERRARFAERSAAARRLLEALSDEARSKGPPPDEAIHRLTEARWWELDRPELRRTVHAVAIVKNAGDHGPARELIEKVASATEGISEAPQFAQAAKALSDAGNGVELRIELLPPVAADGRAADPAQPPAPDSPPLTFSTKFADAVFDLREVGDRSPVVETEFGFHVILLVERIEPHRPSLAERRALLTPELMAARADAMEEQLVERLQRSVEVVVERSAVELTKRVAVEP